jgi:hypothetical protein
MGGAGCMSMALWRGVALSLAGQTSTQSPQPVQSSGATWIVYFHPFSSIDLKSSARNAAGAAASMSGE